MRPGIYDDLSNTDYHGGEGVSKSMLDILAAQTPLHLKASRDARAAAEAPDSKPTSKAFFIGSEFHALLLEPAVFVREYTLAFRQSDMPEAIDSKDALVSMVSELNSTRLPRISTSGSKAELVQRIRDANYSAAPPPDAALSDLKDIIGEINASRAGLLSTSGSMADLATTLRANGKKLTLWSEVKAEWEVNNGHRRILTREQWEQIHGMRDSVMAHPAARALLTGAPGRAERSVYWTDPTTGELCRCRPDFWRDDGILVDIKTTEDASPEGFARSIGKFRYHVQHPYYVDGITQVIDQMATLDDAFFPGRTPQRPRAFVFVVVEKKPPYAVAVYALDAESVEMGRAEYRRDLAKYAECRQRAVWPGHGDKIQNIGLPDWQKFKNAHLLESVA